MSRQIPTTMSSKEQLKFRRTGGLNKKYNQELVAAMVDDVSSASNKLTVSTESVSFSAGAAGTTGVVALDKAPVYNEDGGKVGHKDDTSFAWVTGTVLTTEVDYNDTLSDTAFLATLSNGQFAIDYLSGRVFYKKATTGTSDTCNYNTRQINVEITGSGVGNDVNLKQVGGTNTVTGGENGLLAVAGNIAHDTADAGNPVKVGGKAATSKPAAVADGDRVNAYLDEYGRIHTVDEGGSSVLPVTHRNPQDFAVAYTSNVTVTVSGAPFTVADAECRIAYIYYRPTGGDWQSPLVNGVNGVSITSAANVITVAGAGTPFASGDEYLIGIIYQDKAYNEAVNADQNLQLNPDSETYAGETLVEATGEGDGTTYYYIDMAGYRKLALQIENTDGTAGNNTYTLEGTLQDDGTAADSCTYQDITQYGFTNLTGADAASYTADVMLVTKEDNKALKYVSVKVVRAADGGATDGAWTMYSKRLY